MVELLNVELRYKQEKVDDRDDSDVQLDVHEELNLNVTENLLQTIRDTIQTMQTQQSEAEQARSL